MAICEIEIRQLPSKFKFQIKVSFIWDESYS